jgi:LysM repeat protein
MRLLFSSLALALLALPLAAQSPETGGDSDDSSVPGALRARPLGDPGATQDAEDEREKLLKAADQIDAIEANSEATKVALDTFKTQLSQIEDENTALKAQVSTLQDTVAKQQDALDEMKAARLKERQALIDEVSALVAAKPSHHPAVAEGDDTPPPKKHADDDTAATITPDSPPPLAPPAETPAPGASATASTEATSAPPPAPTHPRKGYYHVVAPHETLSLICEAYRDHGVNVTVAQIRRANGLGARSPLKVGQKLFIPKPGT